MTLRATCQFFVFLGQPSPNFRPGNVGVELTGKIQAGKSN
jgi:hypothetical protein